MLTLLLLLNFSDRACAREWSVIQAGQMFLGADAAGKSKQVQSNPAVGREFAVTTLRIHVGDEINFRNMDKVSHNVYGDDFDLKAQVPGSDRKQKFDHPGEQVIKCAIHPKMKFRLEVAP